MCEERKAINGAIQAVLGNAIVASQHEFEDEHGRGGECELRSYRSGGVLVLICSHVAGALGVSITNAAPAPWEQAEDEIRDRIDDRVVWIEHSSTARSDGQVNHQFEQVIPLTSPRGGVKWKPLGVHVIGGEAGAMMESAVEGLSFEVRGTYSDRLLFAVDEDVIDADEDEDDTPNSKASYIQVSAKGDVEIIVLQPDRTTFIDADEVQPRECAIRAQALAMEHAASHGVRVNPGVVAVDA